MEATPAAFLASLVNELERHPVNSNTFFQAIRDRVLTRRQLQTFARQYYHFCKNFVKELEGLLYRTPVELVDMRLELIKTLHSELGGGYPERAHIRLLERFTRCLDLDDVELHRSVPIPEVVWYLRLLHRLFIEGDHLTALGAELAVEVTAGSEFRYLYPGLKQYPDFNEDTLIFFELHLNEEQCHSAWLIDAVRRTAGSKAGYDLVAAGARQTADGWHRFWRGLYHEVFETTGLTSGSTGKR
jgi:pyrroloquinoline quinone (PQQ) biosynthesis protein C